MELVQQLTAFATRLEGYGLVPAAQEVDNITQGIVKVAQYLGSQGYWVRNERCWSNCYRQKRAGSPSKPTQEIWFECQEEFQESLNDDGGKWDKYAESEGQLTKTAAQQLEVEFSTVMDNSAERMLELAEQLEDYDHSEALAAAKLAQLIKEAQWNWRAPLGNWGGAAKDWFSQQFRPGNGANKTLRDFKNQRDQNLNQFMDAKQQYKNNKNYDVRNPTPSVQLPGQAAPAESTAPAATAPAGAAPADTAPAAAPAAATPQNQQNQQAAPVQQSVDKIYESLVGLDPSRQQYALHFINNQLLPYLKQLDNDNRAFEQGLKMKTPGYAPQTGTIQASTKKVLFKLS